MASGEVGAQRLLEPVHAARPRRHRGAGRRDHRTQRDRDSGHDSRAACRHLSRQCGTRSGGWQSHRHRLCHHRRPGRAARSSSTTQGSSGASPYGINVVKNYTHAYTTFAVRSVLNPELPNNHGSLAPILVEAPVGFDRQCRIAAAVHGTPRRRHVLAERAAQGARPDQAGASNGRGQRCRVDDAGLGQPRRRPAVHHGDVHLRRAASALEPTSQGCRRARIPRASPLFRSRWSRRRRRSASIASHCEPAVAAKANRSAVWARRSSSASTPLVRGS